MGLIKEYRHYYITPWAIIGILINELIILTVFWYTAKAFVPNISIFSGSAVDYFTFIVIGETTLRIPSFFVTIIGRNIRNSTLDGTFESHLLLKTTPQFNFFLEGLTGATLEFLKVLIVLSLACIIFRLDITISSFIKTIPLQILSIFVFAGIGLISVSILLILGRGDSWPMKGVSLATIFAGAYFPTSVLPHNLDSILLYVSPFNTLLETTRSIISNKSLEISYEMGLLALFTWAFISMLIGHQSLKYAIRFHKKRSKPFSYVA